MTMNGDIPGSRRAIERATAKSVIYFLFAMAMLGSLTCICGLVQLSGPDAKLLEDVSMPAVLFSVGMWTFALFFPWSTIVYFARHFLVTVEHLERQNEEPRARIAALSKGVIR